MKESPDGASYSTYTTAALRPLADPVVNVSELIKGEPLAPRAVPDPGAAAAQARKAVFRSSKDAAVPSTMTLEQYMAASIAPPKFNSTARARGGSGWLWEPIAAMCCGWCAGKG